MQIKYGVDNIFDYLPENITTVNVVLDSVNFNLNEFSKKVESFVKKLPAKYSNNDDFFDIDLNQVVTQNDIYKKYNLEIIQ